MFLDPRSGEPHHCYWLFLGRSFKINYEQSECTLLYRRCTLLWKNEPIVEDLFALLLYRAYVLMILLGSVHFLHVPIVLLDMESLLAFPIFSAQYLIILHSFSSFGMYFESSICKVSINLSLLMTRITDKCTLLDDYVEICYQKTGQDMGRSYSQM